MEPASEFVEANGQQLRVLRWGDPASGRPAVMCMSGSGFPALTWRVVAELLADDSDARESSSFPFATPRLGVVRSARSERWLGPVHVTLCLPLDS